jgi:hypothetical protein
MVKIHVICKPLDNHIEFEWKFKFLMKNMKVHVAWWQFLLFGGH